MHFFEASSFILMSHFNLALPYNYILFTLHRINVNSHCDIFSYDCNCNSGCHI